MEKRNTTLLKKFDYNSPVILSFAFLSFIVLILSYVSFGASNRLCFMVYRASLLDPFTYIRLIGHVLGHADYSHYINNMMLFLLVGPMLEEKFGSKIIVEAILVTAVVTGIFQMICFPHSALLGASGVVFMMIVMSSVTSVKSGTIPITLIVVVVLYLGQQIIQGIFTADNVSQFTHIIGGVLGGIFGIVLQKKN